MKAPALIFSAILIFLLASPGFPQGNLTPPGPPAPTMKTLDQLDAKLEKRIPISSGTVITTPGSYYVTAQVSNSSGPTGIVIAASDVTLDLNGFALKGGNNSGPGIVNSGARNNIVIKNGIISNWNSTGISLGSDVTGVRIERITAENNGADGISVGGDAIVTNCILRFNTGNGLSVGKQSVVMQCQAYANFSAGITTGDGSLVAQSAVHDNGDEGIIVGNGSTVQTCSAINHFFSGIKTGNDSTVLDCTAKKNNHGFELGDGVNIQRCTAATNDFDGIRAGNSNLIVGNLCEGNGALTGITNGAGIHTTGTGNRIDGNTTANNDIGVRVEAAGNLIVRNSSRGGTTAYAIATGNSEGQEVNVFNPNATTVITTANPWANFLY